jgi:CheY-like chemotaxis protein
LYRDIQQIRHAAERSAELAGQLLAFARRQTTEPKVLDLNAAVAGMLDLLRRLLGEQIELVWLPSARLWPVKIDPVQMHQILTNLCLNSRDAINGLGTISIATENLTVGDAQSAAGTPPGEYVRIVVRDDGQGIPPELVPRLFEPFFTTKAAGRGTGLGLSTVWGVVHQNGGSIEVQSAPGQGSTFNVYLPRHLGEPTAAGPREPASAQGAGQTLLVVEDELAILDVEQRILERLGYRVLPAATPHEAIRLAQAHAQEIDLLVTDVIMPEMNGRELSARVAAIIPGINTLFLSGYPADVIATHGVLELGVHFLQKPFSVQGISEKLQEVLALRPARATRPTL